MTDIRARLADALRDSLLAYQEGFWVGIDDTNTCLEIADSLLLSLPGLGILDIAELRNQLRSHAYDLGWGRLVKLDHVDKLLSSARDTQ